MPRLLVALALFLALALPACQCDKPPPVGPVEDTAKRGRITR